MKLSIVLQAFNKLTRQLILKTIYAISFLPLSYIYKCAYILRPATI